MKISKAFHQLGYFCRLTGGVRTVDLDRTHILSGKLQSQEIRWWGDRNDMLGEHSAMTSDANQSPSQMTTWTLAAIKRRNLALEGYCQSEGCGKFYVFDLDGLIDSAGPDYVVPEILPGITCLACGGALKVKLAMMPPSNEEGGADTCGSDINAQLQFFEADAEHFYAKMYDATDQTTATGHYSNAKEAFHTAIGLATELQDSGTVQRLQDRLAHVKAVFRSQFS